MDLYRQIESEHSSKNAVLIANYIEFNPHFLKDLLDIIFYEEPKLSQRASWVLSKFSDSFYAEFIQYLPYIFENIQNTNHNAIRRNFARVFEILSSEKYLSYLNESNIDRIVEVSFDLLINSKEKAAIRVYSMYTLSNLVVKCDWIASELRIIIDKDIAGSLPSFRAASKKVLKALVKKGL